MKLHSLAFISLQSNVTCQGLGKHPTRKLEPAALTRVGIFCKPCKSVVVMHSPILANHLLLALFVGQRVCINFSVSRANFLTTLHSYLDITCSCYFWSSLFNVDVIYNYSCSLKCIERNLVNYGYFGSG